MKGTVGRLLAATVTTFALGGGAAAGAQAAQPQLPAPGAVVVKVGDVEITRATVDRWATARRRSPLLEPSERRDGALSNGERRATLTTLIQLRTVMLEAARLHIRVGAGEAPLTIGEFRRSVRAMLPAPATAADRALYLRGQLAGYALLDHAFDAQPTPTDAQLRALWERQREPGWFAPRQVRAEVVELGGRAKARQALEALRAGESFLSVGARLSGGSPVRFHGEPQLFTGSQSEFEDQPPLLRALMKARSGTLIGPVRSDDSWYVARVVEVVAERARIPLAQVRERLVEEIGFSEFRKVYRAMTVSMSRHWRPRTTCVRPFVVRRQCGRVVAGPLR